RLPLRLGDEPPDAVDLDELDGVGGLLVTAEVDRHRPGGPVAVDLHAHPPRHERASLRLAVGRRGAAPPRPRPAGVVGGAARRVPRLLPARRADTGSAASSGPPALPASPGLRRSSWLRRDPPRPRVRACRWTPRVRAAGVSSKPEWRP